MKFRFLFTTLILLISIGACSDSFYTVDPETKIEVDNLVADIEEMKERMLSAHPTLNDPYIKMEFLSTCDSVASSINQAMTVHEFYAKVAWLTAFLNCGHTRLHFSERYIGNVNYKYKKLPLRFFFTGKKMYVREVLNENIPMEEGVQVIALNGIPTEEIITELLAITPSDGNNKTYKYFQLNRRHFGIYSVNEFYPESYTIRFITDDTLNDPVEEILIPSKTNSSIYDYRNRRYFADFHYTSYQFEVLDSIKTGILTIHDFIDFSKKEFNSFLENVFSELSNKQLSNLVIDLRGNDGGDPDHAAELFSYLIEKPLVYFDSHVYGYQNLKKPIEPKSIGFYGDLYVLMDGGSFSTTGHLLSLLKYHKIGTLVGEQSGGSYWCYGCYNDMVLTNSRLELMYSRCTYQTKVDGFGMESGVIPDLSVKAEIMDIVKKRDAAMDIVMQLIITKI